LLLERAEALLLERAEALLPGGGEALPLGRAEALLLDRAGAPPLDRGAGRSKRLSLSMRPALTPSQLRDNLLEEAEIGDDERTTDDRGECFVIERDSELSARPMATPFVCIFGHCEPGLF
jgi:hypothetical protein